LRFLALQAACRFVLLRRFVLFVSNTSSCTVIASGLPLYNLRLHGFKYIAMRMR
jgi:hypothetical protein